jgi:F-type H+-transporting ATPase subunit gamma
MEMVSAAKLRRAQTAVESARPYATDLRAVLANLAQASGDAFHPAFTKREVKHRAIILVSSDGGLCGAFNTNLIRLVEQRIRESTAPTRLVLLGKKGFDYFRRRTTPILASKTDSAGRADWKFAEEMSRTILGWFEAGEVDEVDLVYTRYKSALSRTIAAEPYLPMGRDAAAAEGAAKHDYIYEPSPDEILSRIVPYFLAMRLYMAMAESAASEHGARMVAMGSATKNANEMIQNLILHMNRTRQATITRDLVEIVGGAEALK